MPAADPRKLTPSTLLPGSRRRFGLRFSLRAFLGGVTIFCVILAWQLHRAKQQKDAVAAIRAAGGWVHYDYQLGDARAVKIDPQARPWEPEWVLALVGIDFFHDVALVNMVFNEDGPQRIDNQNPGVNIGPQLAHFPRLRVLLVSGDFLNDEGMREVGRLKRLEAMYYWDANKISDRGAMHFGNLPRLEYLHLDNSQVGDRGLAAIGRLPSLEGLTMQRNKVTDAGLVHLAGHAKIKELWIGGLEDGPSAITDAGVAHLAKIPNLETLDLQHSRVTPAGLAPLQSLPNLKSLMLRGSTADDYGAVAPMFPNCSVDAAKPPPAMMQPAG